MHNPIKNLLYKNEKYIKVIKEIVEELIISYGSLSFLSNYISEKSVLVMVMDINMVRCLEKEFKNPSSLFDDKFFSLGPDLELRRANRKKIKIKTY